MDIVCKMLLPVTVFVLLGLVNCSKMTEEQKKEFAVKLFKQVFVTSTSETGMVSSQFGEIRKDNMRDQIMAYQRMHSMNVTGTLDDQTMTEMQLPRCGMPDMADMSQDNKRRKKRYATFGTKWDNSSPLTYFMKNYSPDLPSSTINRVFKDAFQAWSDVTNLEFRPGTSNNKDIEILFGSREHGDGAQSAFDGPSGVLAHAYFPQTQPGIGGDAHFDEDETWTDNTFSGINLFQVVVHELGHSLGLEHSSVRSAIMFPSYTGYNPNFKLDSDDIEGIQKIYGRKTQPTTSTTTTTTTTPRTTTTTTPRTTTTTTPRTTTTRRIPKTQTTSPTTTPTTTTGSTTTEDSTASTDKQRFCANGRFDAITTFQGVTYVFKDDLFAVLTRTGIAAGYPRPIATKFDGLQGISKIDAALSWNEHATPRLYLFSGSRYWRYDRNGVLVRNYPKFISSGFPGLPVDISAAFVWGRNGRTYVFKGDQYYRLQGSGSQGRGFVDYGYPRAKSVWNIDRALPNIDAVFKWDVNDRTYMFGGDKYIRFNDYSITVDTSSVPYPRNTVTWWLRCESDSLQAALHPAEMEESEDLRDSFVVVPQADDNDHFSSISSAVVLRQWSSIVLSFVVAVKLFIN